MEGRAKYDLHEKYIKAGRDTAHQDDRAAIFRGSQLDTVQ
jgi:hypothetical protein